MATIDSDAIERLGTERIGWGFKGMPADAAALTVAELAAQRRGLFDGGFHLPLFALDRAAIDHNLATMADWCGERGLLLAPHGKTTMAPQLWADQIRHGAWGITVATFSQVRVARAFGAGPLLLANELVDEVALGWLAAEIDRGLEFMCFVDSVAGVDRMTAALRAAGARQPVDVLIELGWAGGRAGARDAGTAKAVADAVAGSPVLRLAGTAAWEGALAHDASAAGLATIEAYLTSVGDITDRFAGEGRFEVPEPIVTAGGSSFFDQVADILGRGRTRVMLRSGCYITHDDGFYCSLSPLARGAGPVPFHNALQVWADVTSRPEPGLALLTMGRRDVSFDIALPAPREARAAGGGDRYDLTGARITQLNDQHAFVRLDPGARLDIGDRVRCGPSHPCTVFDKWQLIPVVEGETVTGFVRTFF